MTTDNSQASMRRWRIGFSIFLVVITALPYILAEIRSGDEWFFSGFLFGVQDGHSYIAKMLRGSEGDWLFTTPYTAYPQTGVVAFLPYLILGKLASAPGLHGQLVVIFHLYRIAGIFFLVWCLDEFVRCYVPEERLRKWGITLAACGGGLGFLFLIGLSSLWKESLPLEMYSPESFGFLMIMGLPHLLFARGFLLLSFMKILQSAGRPFQIGTQAGLGLVLVGVFQPLTVAVAWAVLLAASTSLLLLVWLKKISVAKLREFVNKAAIAIFISSPVIFYTSLKFLSDPILSTWAEQNVIKSPPVGDYLLAYGWILPFAILAIISVLRNKIELTIGVGFLIIWVMCLPIFAYAPYQMQRRLPEGIWVAMVTLALVYITGWQKRSQTIFFAITSLGLLSSAIFWLGNIITAWQPASPAFLPDSQVEFYKQVQSLQIPKNSVVLADEEISMSLPAWLPVRVLIGHGPESANSKELQPRVENFYAGTSKIGETQTLVSEFSVDYVVWNTDKYGKLETILVRYPYLNKQLCYLDLCLLRVDE